MLAVGDTGDYTLHAEASYTDPGSATGTAADL